jgi:hypothetical protein
MTEPGANRIEELGKLFVQALDPMRLQSLAMIDAAADVLWLSSGAMGPDEHALAAEALDAFRLEHERSIIDRRLEDHRRVILLAAREPSGACCGLVLAFVDARGGASVTFSPGANLQPLLRRFSALLARPLSGRPAAGDESALPHEAAPASAAIHARKYARLHSGGSTRRYEVMAGAEEGSDALIVERMITWLARNRSRYEQKPVIFTIVLSTTVLDDHLFLGRVKSALQYHRIERGRIGFGLSARMWRTPAKELGGFLGECEAMGCSVTLDDFSLRHDAIAVLRFPAVRCLKIDAALSAHAMSDRVAQAELGAIVQAARVLGLHCVVKGVPSAAAAKWLAALGIDFVDRLSDGRATGATTKSGEILALDRVG